MGPIVITAKGKAKPDGSPKDVDQEFIASFMIFDELMAKFESTTHGMNRAFKRDPNDDTGRFYAINGDVFGNLLALRSKPAAAFAGTSWGWRRAGHSHSSPARKSRLYQNRDADVIELLPVSSVTVDMVADNPGTWLFHCQVTDHMEQA